MKPRFHIIGVGGVGMSALAEGLLAAGHEVSGSDRWLDQDRRLEVFDRLERAGLTLLPQDGRGIASDVDAVIFSTAIEQDNADLAAADRLGVPRLHRADMLERMLRGRKLIAVAGTAGKTTVTGLLGFLLEHAGLDPLVINGGSAIDWMDASHTGAVRAGQGDWAVAELDESDRSLLRFAPEHAIVTNLSQDHFPLDDTIALFRDFAARVRGQTLCGPGVEGRLRQDPRTSPRLETPDIRLERTPEWRGFVLEGEAYPVALPGDHNLLNALMAVAMARKLGVAPEALRQGLAAFRGMHRRLEYVGRRRGAIVIDDYAHNPAKIEAAWTAARAMGTRVLAYWRPHGYGPLAAMRAALTQTILAISRPSDRLFVLPVFYAGGTADARYTSEDWVAELRGRGAAAEAVPHYAALASALRAHMTEGDVVLGMGARDPDLPLFARSLARPPTDIP